MATIVSNGKSNAQQYLDVLANNGITKLYHFTDRDNLQSIVDNGGLHSWADCEDKGITIAKPGGDMTSRDLDRRGGHQRYVRASFTRNHPMMYVAQKDGRISNPVILEISLDVVTLSDTLFSDRNAVKNGANIGGSLSDLKRIHFSTVKQPNHFNLDDDEKEFYQAEVLVKNFIPLSQITNISSFGIAIPATPRTPVAPVVSTPVQPTHTIASTFTQPVAQPSQPTPTIQLHTPYTAQITRETPTAFIFLVDHSASMGNFTNLFGQDMTCADAVAQILNSQIYELVNRCVKMGETRHYFDIAVIGYGSEVYSGWSGALKGRDFVSPEELMRNPFSTREIKKQVRIRGQLVERTVTETQWFEPRHDGRSTNFHLALQRAKDLVEKWISTHDSRCYPPTIINITDGEFLNSTHEYRMQLANEVKAMYTTDGNVLMFNVHISPRSMESLSFPVDKSELNGNRYATELFDLSSLLPKIYNERIAKLKNIPMDKRLAAMAVNADMQQLVKIMDIGTPTNIKQQ